MKTFVAAAGLAAGASAAVFPRQDQCCFSLTASGGQSGQVGQIGDGQNRIGGDNPAGQYCLSGSSITDGNGRGCILTPPTTQLQCDEGATPDSGFSVSGSGELQHNGDSTFFVCKATDNEYNIYTEQSEDQTGCVEINLSTGGQCGGSGGGSGGSSAPATSAETQPAGYTSPASQPATSAATSLAGPVSSGPGNSAPGYSAPATSPAAGDSTQPGGSATAPSQGVSTIIVTEYTTVCGCSEGAPSGTPGVPTPSQSQPAESQPAESSPAQSQPAPSQPAGYTSQPAPSQPAGYSSSAPVESQPAPSQPRGYTSQSAPSQPVGYTSQPAPSQPAGYSSSAPAESQSVPSQPAGYTSQPAPSQPAEYSSTPATETQPAEMQPATGSQPAGTQPAGSTTQPASQAQPAGGSGSGSACETSLVSGSYETPHLIIPVNSGSPDQSYGTGYNGYLSSENSTLFNFDIPQSDEGKRCSLVFLFPKKEDLETSDYTFNGQGSIDFTQLSGAATEQTTYNSCPSGQQDLGSVTPQPGGSYVVQSGTCAAGTTETVQMTASGGLELEFFEDWNPSPLGLFITTC